MQSIGFLGPALFLTLLSKVQTPAMGHGRVVHGMQSGLMRFRITIHVDLYVASSFSSSFFLEIWLTGVTILFFGRVVMLFHNLGCIPTTKI